MMVLILVLALGVAACEQGSGGVTGDIGSVNGVPIDAADYQMRVNLAASQTLYENGIDVYADEYADILHSIEDMCFDYMVSEILLEEEAARQGIEPDQAFIDEQIEYIKSETSVGGADGYQLYLKQMGITEAFLIKELATSTLYEQLSAPLIADITVTDEEVRAYYDSRNGGVYIYHILLPLTEETTAADVLKRAQDGEDFAALAAEFGTDGTKDIGGSLGLGNADSNWVEAFKTPALSLGPNEIYPELVVSEFGYHIIKSGDAATGSDEDYAEQYESLKQQVLYNQQNVVLEAWLQGLEATADIKDKRPHNH